jgi:simple sugar transport system permease protein
MNRKILSALKPITENLLAILLGFGVGAVLMLIWKFDPIKAYTALFRGAFGDHYGLADTLSAATPMLLTGLTFAIGIRAGLFNIGAQGQIYVGAVAAVAASFVPLPGGFPKEIHLILSCAFAMLAGALWSLPAAFLKSARGVHEVISTIMLNWVAWYLCLYLAETILVDPNRPEKTITVVDGAKLAPLLSGTSLTNAILFAAIFALVIYWVLWNTTLGYEIRSVGLNPDASRYGGIKPARTMATSFILGGLASGLAGATQVLGPPTHALQGSLSNVANLGFDGIAVALIGRNHPIGVILAAIFMGALEAGSRFMQFQAQIPLEMVKVVQGAIILALAIPELLNLFKLFFIKRSR